MPSSAVQKIRTSDGKSARVLIVDDEPLVRWSLCAGLSLARFDPVSAATGAEAVASARQNPPDVVILDLSMEGTDHSALLSALRSAAPHCQFLVMTTAWQDRPVPPGDILVIRKPFDLGEVVVRVDAAVAARRST